MIASFRNKALKRFWTRNDPTGIRPDWRPRIGLYLDQLEQASTPEDLDLLGSGFHPLRGNLSGRFALTVSRNWRLTFGWDGENAVDVDLEDYHGA